MSTDTVLQRVVFPAEATSPDLVPVYVRAAEATASGTTGEFAVVGRREVSVLAGSRVSFDTFFNAFPASYWRRWTGLTHVELHARISGSGRIDVYRSSGLGRVRHVHAETFDKATHDVRIRLPIAGVFGDGGLYWFALSATTDCSLSEAAWISVEPVDVRPTSIGMCTYNRPDDCVTTLRTLIDEADAVAHVTSVIVVDQGDRLVEEHPGFAAVSEAWGGRLRIMRQPNLGGSGGFSRAMFEVLQDEAYGDVILTDDDILPEPESFFRAIMFNSGTGGRVLVGAHMLDLWTQSMLHNTGDMVDTRDFRTRAVLNTLEDVDLSKNPASTTPPFSRRFETDFGGWWMCLIPRPALEKLGLALPVFIKWDDIEYGLRAKAHGIPSVTLPGVAVWHMPFYVKDVQTDWTAYFESRNRLMTALLYGKDTEIRATLLANLRIVVKNLLTMNYSAVRLNQMALDDLVSGPEFIAADLPTVVGRVRAERASFIDAKVLPVVPEHFPSTLSRIQMEKLVRPPKGRVGGAWNIARAVGAAVTPFSAGRTADLSGQLLHWAVLARLDKAVVSTSDGAGVVVRERESGFSEMFAASVRQHVAMSNAVKELKQTYRTALPTVTSPEAWARFFE